MSPENPAPARLKGTEVAALVLALVACRLLVVATFPIYDDAFITYRYAANLAAGSGLVYSPGMPWEPVLGTTAPGYALVLGLFRWLGADMGVASRLFNLACDVVVVLLLMRLFGGRRLPATVAACCFAALPSLARISIGGMEAPLFLAMTLGAVVCARDRRHVLAGVLAALACSVRPEAVLLVAVLGVQRLRDRRALVRYLIPVAVIGAAHAGVLTAIYGSPIPQSVQAKAGMTTEDFPWHRIGQVLLHSFVPLWPLVAVLPVVLLGMARGLLRPARGFLLFALLMVASYIVSGVKTWGWYYYAPLCAWVIGLALGTEWIVERWGRRSGAVLRVALAPAMPVAMALLSVLGVAAYTRFHPDDISSRVYGALAAWARDVGLEEKRATIAASDIGAIGYYSRAVILDTEGLVWPPAAQYEDGVAAVAAELPDYVLLTATRERVLRFVSDPVSERYAFVRRFNASEDGHGEPVTGLLGEFWTQDYVLYARLDS